MLSAWDKDNEGRKWRGWKKKGGKLIRSQSSQQMICIWFWQPVYVCCWAVHAAAAGEAEECRSYSCLRRVRTEGSLQCPPLSCRCAPLSPSLRMQHSGMIMSEPCKGFWIAVISRILVDALWKAPCFLAHWIVEGPVNVVWGRRSCSYRQGSTVAKTGRYCKSVKHSVHIKKSQ